jgi:prepilin-type N-terminal cleavage/methylation domain-containing protein
MVLKNKKGFTLIELIVVVTLLTGLSTLLLIRNQTSRDLSQLIAASRQLESALMQAQSYGNSGRMFLFPAEVANPKMYDRGYGVYIKKNLTKIVIYGGQGDGDGDGDIDAGEDRYIVGNEFEEIELFGGTEVDHIWTDKNPNKNSIHILFRRGETGAHMHTNSHHYLDETRITLKNGGLTRDVVVTKTGLIYSE